MLIDNYKVAPTRMPLLGCGFDPALIRRVFHHHPFQRQIIVRCGTKVVLRVTALGEVTGA